MTRFIKLFLLLCLFVSTAACVEESPPVMPSIVTAEVTRVITPVTVIPTRTPTVTPNPAQSPTPEPRILALYVEANEALGFSDDIRMYSDGFVEIGDDTYQVPSEQMKRAIRNIDDFLDYMELAQENGLLSDKCDKCSEVTLYRELFLADIQNIELQKQYLEVYGERSTFYWGQQAPLIQNTLDDVAKRVELSRAFSLGYIRNFADQVSLPKQERQMLLELKLRESENVMVFYDDLTAEIVGSEATYNVDTDHILYRLIDFDLERQLDLAYGEQQIFVRLDDCRECQAYMRYYSPVEGRMLTIDFDAILDDHVRTTYLFESSLLSDNTFDKDWKD